MSPPSPAQRWFEQSRFGMFVHWGLYALPARHEWVMNIEERTVEDYERYFDHFDPDLYDPRAWAASAQRAGMTYVVLTTKHHEGFCLWDSAETEYTATHSPAKRDLVREFVDAVRAEGLRVGFYYSLLDWHHPEFPIDGFHPLRGLPKDEIAAINARREISRYRQYLHAQVRELLTDYGVIDYLFFDFTYDDERHSHIDGGKGADDWGSEELLRMVRSLQPDILVNDRLGIDGDFVTPEQYQPDMQPVKEGVALAWEACQTINGSWGYDRDNHDDKSTELLVRMLIDGVSKNGNLLLNVGPTARGILDPAAMTALHEIGEWMHLHERSIRGAGAADFAPPIDARYTRAGSRLYLHLFAWPFGHLHLPGLGGKVTYAQFLHDASEIKIEEISPDAPAATVSMPGPPAGTLTVRLPTVRPPVAVPVIELFLSE